MRRRHILAISALIVFTLAIVSICLLTSRISKAPSYKEPTYHGRTLTDWLGDIRPGPTEMPASVAVILIGTNGIPTMFTLLHGKDNSLRDRGFFGLTLLGCNIPEAIPLIEPQLQTDMKSDDKNLRLRATWILQSIQSKSHLIPHYLLTKDWSNAVSNSAPIAK